VLDNLAALGTTVVTYVMEPDDEKTGSQKPPDVGAGNVLPFAWTVRR